MAASLARSSARVAPRSVMRVAATSSTTSSGVRAGDSTAPVQEALRQATGLPVSEIRTMDQIVSRSVSRQRFNMWLMTVFGLAALTLAAAAERFGAGSDVETAVRTGWTTVGVELPE